MNQGMVVEKGTHIELMENKDGVYKQMWEQQTLLLENDEEIVPTARIPPYGLFASLPNGKGK